jgi:hypothetical protein
MINPPLLVSSVMTAELPTRSDYNRPIHPSIVPPIANQIVSSHGAIAARFCEIVISRIAWADSGGAVPGSSQHGF